MADGRFVVLVFSRYSRVDTIIQTFVVFRVKKNNNRTIDCHLSIRYK